MLDRINSAALSLVVWLMVTAGSAAAQTARPPSGQQVLSLEKAWSWLMARPGVIIAIVICIAALAYAIIANRKKKTTDA